MGNTPEIGLMIANRIPLVLLSPQFLLGHKFDAPNRHLWFDLYSFLSNQTQVVGTLLHVPVDDIYDVY